MIFYIYLFTCFATLKNLFWTCWHYWKVQSYISDIKKDPQPNRHNSIELIASYKIVSLYPFSWLVDGHNKGGTSTSKNLTKIVCVPFILYINFRTVGTLGPAHKFGLKNRVPKKSSRVFWNVLVHPFKVHSDGPSLHLVDMECLI